MALPRSEAVVWARIVEPPTRTTLAASSPAFSLRIFAAAAWLVSFVPDTVNWEPPVNSMPRLSPRVASVRIDRATRASAMANQTFLF